MKLMLALDVINRNDALNIVKKTEKYVDSIKIGYPLVLGTGLNIVKEIKELTNKEVICDFKVADIPSTNEKIGEHTLKYADGIICHGFVGSDSIKALLNVAKKYNKKVIVVTEMSHPGAIEFLQLVGNDLAKLAKELNVNGIVAPATRPERLKEIKDIVGNIPIISPGVGAQGGKLDEVKKILTNNDYIIVGRSIYNSENPEKEAKKYSELIKN